MTHPASRGRRWWLGPLVVLGLLATACDSGSDPLTGGGDDVTAPVTLVVSQAWVQKHQGGTGSGGAAGGDDVQARLSSLQEAIDRLRDETGTGWTGRQDDVTGYLAELTGGSWPGVPTDLMDAYGPALFGVDSSVLLLGEPDTQTVPGVVTTRGVQWLDRVPVKDGRLVFVERDGRVAGVHGRVFPGLSVATVPTLEAEQARRVAEQASGGVAQAPPSLVVLPQGAGVLTWLVTVIATSEDSPTPLTGAEYYVDATTGDIVAVEARSAEGRVPTPRLPVATEAGSHGRSGPRQGLAGARTSVTTGQAGQTAPDPNDVEVTGDDPIGGTLTGHGVRTARGVELIDTTMPWWDAATGAGTIQTYDATRTRDEADLPGELVVSPDTTVRDKEAIAAHALSRDVLDYYAGLGRTSWDGQGGALYSSVNFGPSDYCNSFFTTAPKVPQMVYGNPCTTEDGQLELTEVEIDTTAHEITHGVTETTADLKYTGQSGALNEGFSDYFGNVIGNAVKGIDDARVFEGSCQGITTPNRLCKANPDGTLSIRYMLNGNDFDDYLRVLDPGFRLSFLGYSAQDQGGVHFNSAIWNNALWTIRSRLAQVDGTTGNESELARSFDRAVYGALATRLGPTSGFVDARAAVEQVIADSGLAPVVLRTAREVFDANKICTGCPDTGELGGDPVSTSPSTQQHPVVSGDSVAWLDLSGSGDIFGYAGSARIGGAAPTLGASAEVLDLAFAGDALITFDAQNRVARYAADGTTTPLGTVRDFRPTVAAGVAGSDAGAAWVADDTVSYVDPAGSVTSTRLPGLQGDSVTGLGAGAGIVGMGTDGGKVLVWQPGGQVRQIGELDGAVISVAAYAGNVVAVSDDGVAALFTADGQSFRLSGSASPFGVTLGDRYAVWAERRGPIEAGVAGGVSKYPETDLYLASLATGKIYELVRGGGQQGFPSLSGDRLVWQDAAFGGDDVLTVVLPDDL